MNMKYVLVLVLVIAIAAIAAIAEGAEYTVGDDMGWMVPPTPDYYASWVSKYYFVENDTLVFNFDEGVHDITVLTKEDFDACNMKNPIAQFPRTSTNNTTGHCTKGQKIATHWINSTPPMPEFPSPFPSSALPVKFHSKRVTKHGSNKLKVFHTYPGEL